jgi:hypothetical protein
MALHVTLLLEEEECDKPGLAYALALAKHDKEDIIVNVGGFSYSAEVRRVQLDPGAPDELAVYQSAGLIRSQS